MRIHRFVLIAVIVGLSAVVVKAATDEDRVGSLTRSSSSVAPLGDCCIDAVESDFPLPPLSARGNHCPSAEVPDGTENQFDPNTGRLMIAFHDAATGYSGSFVLDITDAACFEHPATRAALFAELVLVLQTDPSVSGEEGRACTHLKEAIREGSLELGEQPFDLRIARPYVDEVCPYS